MAVVAVINSSADTVEMLSLYLQQEGFEPVTAHIDEIKRGSLDFLRFVEEHDPHVIVYDVAPPYEQNWTYLNMLRRLDVMQGRAVVITTTHKENLERLVGPTGAIEIIGKPYDMQEVVTAVKRAVDGA
jgi:DNA-binding response OmpR family regulator